MRRDRVLVLNLVVLSSFISVVGAATPRGATVTADVEADNPGEWMLHCHVSDHIAAGMMTTYQILP